MDLTIKKIPPNQVESYRLSVTALADFSCKTGDLDLSNVAGPSAREGIRAHQKIQKRETKKSESIESEVTVRLDHDLDGARFHISGRLDLLDRPNVSVREIKTTLVPVDKLSPAQIDLNWAQAMIYGYCVFANRDAQLDLPLSQIVHLELLYVNIRAEEEYRLRRDLSLSELSEFFENALRQYLVWIRKVSTQRALTTETANSIDFPHPDFRQGQRDMAAAVFRATRDNGRLLCEAPTGTGKTISCLFPAVKSIGNGTITHVTYLTAKSSGVVSALDTMKQLTDKGLSISAVALRAKQLCCFCSTGQCERDDKGRCPMTIGFFDRLPEARLELLDRGVITGDVLDKVALEHSLCPFELALQMLPWVSLVVCDYNYVYDPLVRLGWFNEARKDTLILVDEAHNLIDRSRSMFGAVLSRRSIKHWTSNEKSHPMLVKRANTVSDALKEFGKGLADTQVSDTPPESAIHACSLYVEAYMEAVATGPAPAESMFELFKAACRFLAIKELYSENHRVVTSVTKSGQFRDVQVELLCLDAADALNKQYKLFKASVFFSATLRPTFFFQRALGLGEDARQQQLPSPFAKEQSLQLLVTHINTRYRHRESSLTQLIAMIEDAVRAKEGNYIVFFPSYVYLELAHREFVQLHPDIDTWTQNSDLSRAEQQQLLASLDKPGTRVGFAIMGGVFGEGVDYVGDKLIGLIVIGVGLPGISVEQDLISDHYQAVGLDGYDFAYRYPGFTRVLQTVGRLIRDEKDRGIVLLVDDRFNSASYQSLFPAHWRLDAVHSQVEINTKISQFWDVN